MSEVMKADFERKISSLESKLKVAYMEIKKEQQLKEINNQSLTYLQKHHEDLLKEHTHAKDEVFNHEKTIKALRQRELHSISKEQSEQIQQKNITLMTELRETKSAMLSYKNLHSVVVEQVKSLKLLVERRKDENESLQQTVREMASESVDKTNIDKHRYIVMLSRW